MDKSEKGGVGETEHPKEEAGEAKETAETKEAPEPEAEPPRYSTVDHSESKCCLQHEA